MQTLANYDPYAIQQIEFFVQKKTKYTTLKSIIVSLAILALTVLLNWSVIQHLWIDKSQLPLVSNSRKMSLENMTSSYICVFPKTVNDSLPNTFLKNYDVRYNQTFKIYQPTTQFDSYPEVMNISNGRKSICYDIQGAVLTNFYYLRLVLYSTNESDFDFMFKTYTASELIQSSTSNYYSMQGDAAQMGLTIRSFQIKKISAIYYDKLLVNYEPQKIVGLSTRIDYIRDDATGIPQDGSFIDIFSQYAYPFDQTDQYILTRYNIADILGRLLSWFSVFVMICAFGVSPILDYNYKVQLAQKLYDNHKLSTIDISLLSYGKYLLSKIKKKLFNQDVLDTAFQQLQKDLDLLNLIKRQNMMKKLIKQNQSLNIQPKQVQNAISQDDIVLAEVLIGKQLSLTQNDIQDQNLMKKDTLITRQDQCPLVTQPDEQSGDNFITKFIKSFDNGEVQISLISNKGQGYKTSWNTIITVLFLCAVLWFIVFAGLFQLDPNYTLQTIPLLADDSIYPSITLNPQDIIFRLNKSLSATYNLSVVMVDLSGQVIQNLTLLNGTACDSYVRGLNQTVGANWLCLNKSIKIFNDGRGNKTKLGLRILYRTISFVTSYIEGKIAQYEILNNQLIRTPFYFKNVYSASNELTYRTQAILLQSDDNGTTVNLICNRFVSAIDRVFKGISFQVGSEFIRIKKVTPSLWDVINNAWGIVVLAFSVFLSKITRYLNVRQRQRITQSEQNENRNDIIAIISTQYKLIYRVFYEELKQVKYFYKTKMNDLQFKER